jgi:hypothetical protein
LPISAKAAWRRGREGYKTINFKKMFLGWISRSNGVLECWSIEKSITPLIHHSLSAARQAKLFSKIFFLNTILTHALCAWHLITSQ